jgi:D-sedoheptulose 7-phosphate isomerase
VAHLNTDDDMLVQLLVARRLQEQRDILDAIRDSGLVAQVGRVAVEVASRVRLGAKVLFFGNGGSSADAAHLAAELMGRFYVDRKPLPALSLADSVAALTAIANDYSYGDVFSRQLEGLAQRGDVAIGLSTSGNSDNVVHALESARKLGLYTIALTGESGGAVKRVVDECIRVPTADTPRVQEACMHLGHTLCELVEELATSELSTAR